MEKINLQIGSYETLNNGFLKIKSRVFREDVYPVEGEFVEDDREVVNIFYPIKEFSSKKSIASLEAASVVDGHLEIDISNKNEACGNVLGAATVDGGDIYCDLLITDQNTIERIKSKELKDVSVFFSGKYISNKGSFEGKIYDGIFSNINFNHVALLEQGSGRMGLEVKIFNGKQGVKMSDDNKKIEELKKIIEDLTSQNEELIKKSSEEELHAQMKKASDDNKKAEIIDCAIETKIANSGLYGKNLYKSALQAFGVDTENIKDPLEFGYDIASKISGKLAQKRDSKNVKIPNHSDLIISSDMNPLDRIEMEMKKKQKLDS